MRKREKEEKEAQEETKEPNESEKEREREKEEKEKEKKEKEKEKEEEEKEKEKEIEKLFSNYIYPHKQAFGLPPSYSLVPLSFQDFQLQTVVHVSFPQREREGEREGGVSWWDSLFSSFSFSSPSPSSPSSSSSSSSSSSWILFFHGNGECIENYISSDFVSFFTKRGYHVALAEYRGYSPFCKREQPTPFSVARDSLYLLRYLDLNYKPKKIIVYGRSIGTISAAALAGYCAFWEREKRREESGEEKEKEKEKEEEEKEEEEKEGKEEDETWMKEFYNQNQQLSPTSITSIIIESGLSTSSFLSLFLPKYYTHSQKTSSPLSPDDLSLFSSLFSRSLDITKYLANFCERGGSVSLLHSKDDHIVSVQNFYDNLSACQKALEGREGEERERRESGKRESGKRESGRERERGEVRELLLEIGRHSVRSWNEKEVSSFLHEALF